MGDPARGFAVEIIRPGLSFGGGDSGLGAIGRIDRATVAPRHVIGMHPHRDDEILTYVRAGRMLHRDTVGNEEEITATRLMMMGAGHTFQHELQVAADAGVLGSIDANRGVYQNGWDTDQFPNDINELTEAMLIILEAGGLQGGGVNFDAKIRRNSTDAADLFYAHIGGMDTFARALVTADAILQKSDYKKIREERYASFDSGKGAEFEAGKLSLEDLRAYAVENGEPEIRSGRQEYMENLINRYI